MKKPFGLTFIFLILWQINSFAQLSSPTPSETKLTPCYTADGKGEKACVDIGACDYKSKGDGRCQYISNLCICGPSPTPTPANVTENILCTGKEKNTCEDQKLCFLKHPDDAYKNTLGSCRWLEDKEKGDSCFCNPDYPPCSGKVKDLCLVNTGCLLPGIDGEQILGKCIWTGVDLFGCWCHPNQRPPCSGYVEKLCPVEDACKVSKINEETKETEDAWGTCTWRGFDCFCDTNEPPPCACNSRMYCPESTGCSFYKGPEGEEELVPGICVWGPPTKGAGSTCWCNPNFVSTDDGDIGFTSIDDAINIQNVDSSLELWSIISP